MTPYEFLQRYDREEYNGDPRLVEGGFFPSSKLGVDEGKNSPPTSRESPLYSSRS
jgi:hypothetical protein